MQAHEEYNEAGARLSKRDSKKNLLRELQGRSRNGKLWQADALG